MAIKEYTKSKTIQGNLDRKGEKIEVKGEDTVLEVTGVVICDSLEVDGAKLKVHGGINKGTFSVKNDATAIIDGNVSSHYVTVHHGGSLFVSESVLKRLEVSERGKAVVSKTIQTAETFDNNTEICAGGVIEEKIGNEDFIKSSSSRATSRVNEKLWREFY